MADNLRIVCVQIAGIRTRHSHMISRMHKYTPNFIQLQETNIHTGAKASQITTQLGLKHSMFSLAVHNTGSGTAILQTSDSWGLLKTHMDSQGRISIAHILNNRNTYIIVNIQGHPPPQTTTTNHNFVNI